MESESSFGSNLCMNRGFVLIKLLFVSFHVAVLWVERGKNASQGNAFWRGKLCHLSEQLPDTLFRYSVEHFPSKSHMLVPGNGIFYRRMTITVPNTYT